MSVYYKIFYICNFGMNIYLNGNNIYSTKKHTFFKRKQSLKC